MYKQLYEYNLHPPEQRHGAWLLRIDKRMTKKKEVHMPLLPAYLGESFICFTNKRLEAPQSPRRPLGKLAKPDLPNRNCGHSKRDVS